MSRLRLGSTMKIGQQSKAIKSSISLTEPTAHALMILIPNDKLISKFMVQNSTL